MRVCLLLFGLEAIHGVCFAGAGDTLPIPIDDTKEWHIAATGRFEAWTDRRALLVLYHPWEESMAGDSVAASTEVTIPSDWTGRVRLHFYATDDYDGVGAPLEEGWLGQANLVGHRYKQALIDDAVVWESDVADAEGVAQPSRFSVLLPERVRAGDTLRIGFRLFDKTASSVRLPGDHRHIGETDGIEQSDPWRFMTHLYVGDVVLTPEDVEWVPPGVPSSAGRARALHEERWPVKEPCPGIEFPVSLAVQGGCPKSMDSVIRCGVPLPRGKVRSVEQVALSTHAGDALPLQAKAMNHWPDGSVRWVEIDTVALRESGATDLLLDVSDVPADGARPAVEAPVRVRADGEGGIRIRSGSMRVVVGGPDGVLVRRVTNGGARIEDFAGRIELADSDEPLVPIVEKTEVLAEGPVRGEVQLSGTIRSSREEMGRFVLRLSAFAGQPYVRMTWRVFNDRPETLGVTRFELVGGCDMGADPAVCWGSEGKAGSGDVAIRQLEEDRFDVVDGEGKALDSGNAAPGWLGLSGGRRSTCVLVRHFAEQYPKAIAFEDGRLRISLFEASEANPAYRPNEGEAKRHEVWLGLWKRGLTPGELQGAAQLFANPPRLFDSDYFCASGGLGRAYPHDEIRFPRLTESMRTAYGDIAAGRFYGNGMRNWGDRIYNKEQDQWCNGYYDRQQGFAVEYLMTGDIRWFERLEATVRHIIDVDVCHHSEEHPEWVGGIHGYFGANHSTEVPWNPTQRTKGTFAYWRYTGDIDARDAALAVADSAIGASRGIGAVSVRDHAGILYCLTAAYDETHDPKYLEAARRVAHDAIGRIDGRRGCYSEIHGNVSYRGNVPWMVAQLAEPLYDYYRQSGDVDAAVAVVGLAESVITENCTRDVAGDVYGYSHNPHFNKTSGYHILIAPAVLYAYELTGDAEFLAHARAMFEQTLEEKTVNSIVNCYWNTQTLLYYLKRYGKDGGDVR